MPVLYDYTSADTGVDVLADEKQDEGMGQIELAIITPMGPSLPTNPAAQEIAYDTAGSFTFNTPHGDLVFNADGLMTVPRSSALAAGETADYVFQLQSRHIGALGVGGAADPEDYDDALTKVGDAARPEALITVSIEPARDFLSDMAREPLTDMAGTVLATMEAA